MGRGLAVVKVGLIFVGILILAYLIYVGYIYYIQRWVLFPRHLLPPVYSSVADFPGWKQQWFETPATRVEGWFAPPAVSSNPGVAPLFIITHGNGELIDIWPPRVVQLQRQGYGVLLVEYPGYGRSTGEPSEAEIRATLSAAYDWAVAQPGVDPQRVILFGYSVGGGAIGTLAAQRPSAALVLMSTFSSVRAMAQALYLPGFLARDPFDTTAVVQHYANPILLIHGTKDTIIPHTNSIALKQAAPSSKLLLLPCGHHDCVEDWEEFWLLIEDFLRERHVF